MSAGLLLAMTLAIAADAVPPVDAPANGQGLDAVSARAIAAFDEVCLKNAGSLGNARRTATSSPWSFVRKGDLPAYGRGPAMETYASGDVELMLRTESKGFGCLVVYQLGATTSPGTLVTAISSRPGLTAKGGGKGKVRWNWDLGRPAGSKVQLTVYPNMTPRAPILALESKGSTN